MPTNEAIIERAAQAAAERAVAEAMRVFPAPAADDEAAERAVAAAAERAAQAAVERAAQQAAERAVAEVMRSFPVPAAEYLNTIQAAVYCNYSTEYFEIARHKGAGPPYIKQNTAVRYRRADLDAWMESARITNEPPLTIRARKQAAPVAGKRK